MRSFCIPVGCCIVLCAQLGSRWVGEMKRRASWEELFGGVSPSSCQPAAAPATKGGLLPSSSQRSAAPAPNAKRRKLVGGLSPTPRRSQPAAALAAKRRKLASASAGPTATQSQGSGCAKGATKSKSDAGSISADVGLVTETRAEHQKRHAGADSQRCARCKYYKFEVKWAASYGCIEHREGKTVVKTRWLCERPARRGGQ